MSSKHRLLRSAIAAVAAAAAGLLTRSMVKAVSAPEKPISERKVD